MGLRIIYWLRQRKRMRAGQRVSSDLIDLIRPFETEGGIRGPDLARPRPELRIVAGKLGGSPHVTFRPVVLDGRDIRQAFKPMFDELWQAAGEDRSLGYSAAGAWIEDAHRRR